VFPGGDTALSQGTAEVGSQTVRCKSGELASHHLHLRCSVEPQNLTKMPWRAFLEPLGMLDPRQRHQQQSQHGGTQAIEGWPDAAVDLTRSSQHAALDEAGNR
jgi:hypothetical protein